jgi:drug/metabolite transporter (DMT)-like permease
VYGAPMLGEALALGAALAWSVAVILFRRSEAITPLGMNLFKNSVAVVLLALTLPVLGQGIAWQRPSEDWWKLCVSGVLGIGIADTLIFMALRRLGPGRLAIVDCVYAPVIVLASVVFLGERVGPAFLIGAVLVVGGVLLGATTATRARRPKADRTPIVVGVVLGVSGIVAMALGVVLAKRPLERSNLVEVTLVRLVAGIASQLVWIALVPAERSAFAAFRPGRIWRTLVPAAVLSAYVSMLLWLGGFKWANASTAAVLNQMSTVFTIVLARLVLGEPLTRRRALGGLMAISGAIIVLKP